MSKLVFRYLYDDNDDVGWFDIAVITANFAGRGGFSVRWQDINAFGETLSTYPITPESPLKLAWLEGDNPVVGVEIAPANVRGDLRVQVEVSAYPDQRLRTSFITNYPDLERFRLAIAEMMNRKVDEAVLLGR